MMPLTYKEFIELELFEMLQKINYEETDKEEIRNQAKRLLKRVNIDSDINFDLYEYVDLTSIDKQKFKFNFFVKELEQIISYLDLSDEDIDRLKKDKIIIEIDEVEYLNKQGKKRIKDTFSFSYEYSFKDFKEKYLKHSNDLIEQLNVKLNKEIEDFEEMRRILDIVNEIINPKNIKELVDGIDKVKQNSSIKDEIFKKVMSFIQELKNGDIDRLTNLYGKAFVHDWITIGPSYRKGDEGKRFKFKKFLENITKKFDEIGLLNIDLGNFKIINDVYGHHIGDEALRMIANELKSFTDDKDFVIRNGGDEFLIITSYEKALEIEKIFKSEEFIQKINNNMKKIVKDNFEEMKKSYNNGDISYEDFIKVKQEWIHFTFVGAGVTKLDKEFMVNIIKDLEQLRRIYPDMEEYSKNAGKIIDSWNTYYKNIINITESEIAKSKEEIREKYGINKYRDVENEIKNIGE